jgi:metal-responsive CopG/Arc/MetJ family transcriptional regulator
MSDVVSIAFELPNEKLRELELLMERAGLKSRKDLINTALSLFEWVVKEQEGGKTIASLDQAKKHCKELRIPGLSITPEKRPDSG